MRFHLGIDVSKAKLDCSLRLANGKFRSKVVTNNDKGFKELSDWLLKHEATDVHICMEATGIYWEAVAIYLAHQGLLVSVLNPAQIKAFGQSHLVRGKTDQIDAQVIASFCFERKPEAWQPPPQSELALRALILRLESLQNMRTQETNRLEVAREAVQTDIVKHIEELDVHIKTLEKEINNHIDSDPDLKDKYGLLESVPGLGPRTISTMLSFGFGSQRFENARQAAAYAGLDPRQYRSGTSVQGKPRMSKMGNAHLRKSLYMPAMTTLYRTDWGKIFRARLLSAGKAPKLIIGAMMRKLIHVAFGVMKSGKPFDATLHGLTT